LKARGKTVVLTTHYMDEAERLCDRVGIVDHGKMIAQGTPSELIHESGGFHLVELETEPKLNADVFKDVAGVRNVRQREPAQGGALLIAVDEPHVALPALFSRLAERQARPTRLLSRAATLDDVFLALTGRTLRED
jgi:ABC-2 type transport system ATP-binding protein